MSSILLFKLLSAPALILGLTLITRRYGHAVAGRVMGIPLVTGPISVFTAIEQGPVFAQHAAAGNLVGQVSTCLFSSAFAVAARRLPVWASAGCGVAAFAAATLFWNQFQWSLPPAFLVLLASLVLLGWLLPNEPSAPAIRPMPRWDLPVRLLVSMVFVLVLTSVAATLGPQLSGLVAPFPAFVLILLVFAHVHHGPGAVAAMARGVVLGSAAFAAFFVVAALTLDRVGLISVYGIATAASLLASASVHAFTRTTKTRGRA